MKKLLTILAISTFANLQICKLIFAGNMPAVFRKNMGQWEEKILYQSSSAGVNVYFMKDGLSFATGREVGAVVPSNSGAGGSGSPDRTVGINTESEHYEYLVWNLYFEGAKSDVEVIAEGRQDSRTNYFLGNDPSKWVINAPDYALIKYNNIYDNIDLHYYTAEFNSPLKKGVRGLLKYDYILHPDANIESIKMSFEGIEKLAINEKGQLEVRTSWGRYLEEAPYTYQIINGIKKKIDIRYELLDKNSFGFRAYENYDKSYVLIIDPFIQAWGTYMQAANSNTANYSYDIATDANGDIYITGRCDDGYPTTPGAYQTIYGGGTYDAYVTKLKRDGSDVIYTTYVGGPDSDWGGARAIAVNSAGEAYVAGYTGSDSFPTTPGAFQTNYGGGLYDVFVFKLNAAGDNLIYSTYLGGPGVPGTDLANDIALNSSGEAYIIGSTGSWNFPTTTGTYGGGTDIFVTILGANGDTLVYSTFLGGTGDDYGNSIALNSPTEVYIAGRTGSTTNFTTPGAFQTVYGGGNSDAFVSKLDITGDSLIYSTYLGAPGFSHFEQASAIALNSAGEAYVVGLATTDNFPITSGAYQTARAGNWDIFVTRLGVNGDTLVYSTYLGGTNREESTSHSIVVNSVGEAYLTGLTQRFGGFADFPVTPCNFQTNHGGLIYDLFIVHLCANGDSLCGGGATYVGGNDNDYSPAMILDESGIVDTIIITGTSHSTDFPTTPGTYEPNKINGGGDQPVVFKMFVSSSISTTITPDTTICNGDSVQLVASGGTNYSWTPSTGLSDTAIANPIASPTTTTIYTVIIVSGFCGSDTVSVTVTVIDSIIAAISPDTSICQGDSVQLIASGGINYSWSPSMGLNDTSIANPTATPITTTTYQVIVSGCGNPDTAEVTITVTPYPIVDLGKDTTICFGDSITLDAGNPGASYNWSTGESTQAITVDIAGTFWVEVNDSNCIGVDTITIVDSTLVVDLGADTTLCLGESITLNAGNPGASFLWNTGATTQTITVSTTGNYAVELTDSNNCSSIDTIDVSVVDCDTIKNIFFIPNSFSPNEDEDNDILLVRGSRIKNIKLFIYNRWGEKVFETFDITKGWDGTYRKKPLNTAVFAWYAEVEFEDANKVYRKGNVTLIR